MIGVVFALGILCLVVLWDAMLLSFLNALPVSLEGDVEHGIAVEHQLCWGCTIGRVDHRVDCMVHSS